MGVNNTLVRSPRKGYFYFFNDESPPCSVECVFFFFFLQVAISKGAGVCLRLINRVMSDSGYSGCDMMRDVI